MAFANVIATANYLENAACPVSDLPISVGCWINMPAVGSTFRAVWFISNPAVADVYFGVGITSAELLLTSVRSSGVADSFYNASATALGAGNWVFVLARGISATSRRTSIYRLNGANAGLIEHSQGTVSRLPASMTLMSIGARVTSSTPAFYLGGGVAEFWYTNTDIVGNDIATPNDLLLQLAMQGPFSVPHIVKDIVEYRSFRTSTYTGDIGDVYFGAGKPATIWTPVNTPTVAQHVWLRKEYVSPKPPASYHRPPTYIFEGAGAAGHIFKLAGSGGLVGTANGLAG